MKALKTNKVFVSVYLNNKSLEVNNQNHKKAQELLSKEGINFQVLTGIYKNNRELTFLLQSTSVEQHENNLDTAHNLGLLFNQESFLEVSNDDTAVLHFLSGQDEVLKGTFREVTEKEAIANDNYTYEPIDNRYFVVR